MSVTMSAHQPDFFPYMPFFYKVMSADVFVFLDDVQFSSNGWHNFNYIRQKEGVVKITVPVAYRFGAKINEVKVIMDVRQRKKMLKSIEFAYSRCPYFSTVYPDLEMLLSAGYETLADMNIAILSFLFQKFGINTKLYVASQFGMSTEKTQRLIDLCKSTKSSIYLSGIGAKDYLLEDCFKENGIWLVFVDVKPIEYPQRWPGFVKDMSVIDYVMNCGYHLPEEWK